MATLEDIISFYEDFASDTRSVFKDFGQGMLDFIICLQHAPELNIQDFHIEHVSLAMEFKNRSQWIYVLWSEPDKYVVYLDRRGDDLDSFYGDKTTVSLNELIETIKEYREKIT
ncbi:MAG: hypothetical protein F9K27_14610 [Anaerolineae bacterium]|nr:MAG: hypothetical protein F9K27_14610 [Anaerolineae bacterium]